MIINCFFVFLFLFGLAKSAQSLENGEFVIARIKYDGGGDWYSDPSSIPNLLKFIGGQTLIKPIGNEARVRLKDDDLFSYPYLYITGHGNIIFDDQEIKRLRLYLESGGFIHADDNYGMDKSFRRQIRRAFPYNKWVELSHSHPIFHVHFSLPKGLPKVHHHDGKRPQLLGLYVKDRLAVVYSYQSDLGDGWEDSGVHAVSEEKRVRALRMGTNLVVWALSR
tara:strand:+ start:245 stop:910 length:666 start_codon:yes stop_codon:yes gene_type:complete